MISLLGLKAENISFSSSINDVYCSEDVELTSPEQYQIYCLILDDKIQREKIISNMKRKLYIGLLASKIDIGYIPNYPLCYIIENKAATKVNFSDIQSTLDESNYITIIKSFDPQNRMLNTSYNISMVKMLLLEHPDVPIWEWFFNDHQILKTELKNIPKEISTWYKSPISHLISIVMNSISRTNNIYLAKIDFLNQTRIENDRTNITLFHKTKYGFDIIIHIIELYRKVYINNA